MANHGRKSRSTHAEKMSAARAAESKKLAAAQKKEANRIAAEVKQKDSDDRFTSPELIRYIESSFGPIDFDPCWHEASNVRPKAYLDVRQGQNGMRDEWSGRFAFVNPPWSRADKWIRRSHEQWKSGKVATILCLIPSATGSRFFHEVLSVDADVYFLQGRPVFSKVDNTFEATMRQTMLVMFGATAEQKMRLAELVEGSWWLPSRSSPIRSLPAGDGGDVVTRHSSASCVSSYPRSLIVDIVLCSPKVGRDEGAKI